MSASVMMLLSNAFRPDPRVAREAQALIQHGYRVTLVCWDRRAELPARETQAGLEIIRVQTVRSGYGSGWRQLFYLPRFWREAIRQAGRLRPDIIHCHDLDTLYAGQRIKKQLACPLVYDAHEHYPALMSLYLPAPFIFALTHWESRLMGAVDATITASTILRDEFLDRGFSPVVTLGNFPELAAYTAVTEAETQAVRAGLGLSPGELLVAYIGGFSHNRMLRPLIESAALLPQAQVHLWGDGVQRPEVEQAVRRYPNAHYHGWLAVAALPLYFKAADVIYYCLRLDYPGAVYNAPNTLSQAMAAGRPIIANDVGDLGRIVREARCGLLIREATPPLIVQALKQLQDPHLRTRLGRNALQSARNKYNLTIGQRQLLDLYAALLS